MTIRLSEYVNELDDIEPGQTIRINHESCPAGEDTRRRLYITRPHAKPHSVVAYCHNCQSSGYRDTDTYQDYRASQHKQTKQVTNIRDVVEPPLGMIEDPRDWPNPAIQWMMTNALWTEAVLDWDIQYDPTSNRVYLPRYGDTTNKELQGYQLRKIVEDNSPKYYTVSRVDDTGFTNCNTRDTSSRYTIVEDLVSAIHVQAATRETNVIINYGTKINIEALYAAAGPTTKRFFVWLDNDSAHVKNQARHMQQTYNLLKRPHTNSYVVQDYSDPKHYGPDKIRSIFEETFNG